MRIVRLTPRTEKWLLSRRAQRDTEVLSVASEIVADVRKRGDPALFAWTKKLDSTDLARTGVWISPREFRAAERRVSSDFLQAIKKATRNIRRVAEQQLPRPCKLEVEAGVTITQRISPIETIGCYIPGGRFSLVSTLVMTVVPAKVAGVSRIVAVCPKPSPELLSAAKTLGIEEIARIGGAQAIAALAYGTKSIPRIDKLFGPGNKYVTAGKQLVSGDCAIDLPAGPTEAIVLAADGNPRWIAADLLAQAEHAKDAASLLVTTSQSLARDIQREIRWQLAELPPGFARVSTELAGAILVADSLDHACAFVNRFCPRASQPSGERGKIVTENQFCRGCLSRALGSTAPGRLRQRRQSRPAYRRLGPQARWSFCGRLCEMHQRADHHSKWFFPSRRYRGNSGRIRGLDGTS
jgi:histidinol dehydrogenase